MSKLNDIWADQLVQVINRTPADRDVARAAANALYRQLGYPEPAIGWWNGSRPARGQVPIHNLNERMWFGLLPYFRTRGLYELFGYDPMTGIFPINQNKRVFLVRSNVICQFDAPAIVLAKAARLKRTIPDSLRALAARYCDLLNATFGALLFEDTCYLIDRPLHIGLDPQQQLSNNFGPAFALRSNIHEGSSDNVLRWGTHTIRPRASIYLYAVNGVMFDPPIGFRRLGDPIWEPWKSDTLSLGSRLALEPYIMSLPPARRSAIMNYITLEALFRALPSATKTLVHSDSYGELYRLSIGNDQFFAVRVRNRTKEPDGSYKRYVIAINAECRPLPDPANPSDILGAPQPLTARNAVASTFGLTGEQYARMLGAQS